MKKGTKMTIDQEKCSKKTIYEGEWRMIAGERNVIMKKLGRKQSYNNDDNDDDADDNKVENKNKR
jgi:hypothetical protein